MIQYDYNNLGMTIKFQVKNSFGNVVGVAYLSRLTFEPLKLEDLNWDRCRK